VFSSNLLGPMRISGFLDLNPRGSTLRNAASDWHQLAIHKLADWTKLHILMLLFFDCMTKNEIFARTLLHKVKQQNETNVVEKFYMVDILTVYHTYLPNIINVALNLPKLL